MATPIGVAVHFSSLHRASALGTAFPPTSQVLASGHGFTRQEAISTKIDLSPKIVVLQIHRQILRTGIERLFATVSHKAVKRTIYMTAAIISLLLPVVALS